MPFVKKPLTDDQVNGLADAILRHHPGTEEQARELKRDWKAFLEKEFTLTAAQKLHLEGIPPAEVRKIHNALAGAVDDPGEIRLRLGSETSGARGELTIHKGGRAPALRIPILHCTFNADCTGWQCGPGPG